MKIRIIVFLASIALLVSCSKSLVYSPSLNIPLSPLKEKEIDLQGGVELLPEARAENLGGKMTTIGVNGKIGYGFSNKFNLSLNGWVDIEGRENLVRLGYSITGQFLNHLNEKSRIIIIPRVGMALNGDNISGYGIATSILYQKELSEKLGYYIGVGFIWGFRGFGKNKNSDGEYRIPMGIGIVGNLGLTKILTKELRLNIELNPIYQINTFDKNQQFILSPQIGIGYTIRRP